MRPLLTTTPARLLRLIVGGLLLPAAAAAGLPMEPAALAYTNTHALTAAEPNLTGEGVLIAAICRSMTYRNGLPQNDYRFNMDHDCLFRGNVAFEDGSDGRFSTSSHATAVAGVLLGNKDNATHPATGAFDYRGACPGAAVDVYEFRRFETLYLFDQQPFAADIITLSLGEVYEDWWTRALDRLAGESDRLVIASIGNGQGAYGQLYPGAGANAIGVGVIDAAVDDDGTLRRDDFSTPSPRHSSAGPTDNHRCKPDIVAPGTALVPMHNNLTDYSLETNWSSLAAPIVSGTAALLLQKAYSDPAIAADFDGPGKSSLIKAILLNSATKLPYWHKGAIGADDDTSAPLDYHQGAGALNAAAAMAQLTAGRQGPGRAAPTGWDNRVLTADQAAFNYVIDAAEPNRMLTATLCWNRYYQPDYPFAHDLERDTDLRLELWGIDAGTGEAFLLDFSDSVNDNVEHLYFRCIDGIAAYYLRVRFNDQQVLTDRTRQRFALAFRVSDDTAAGSRWWYDINGDSRIDAMDRLAYQLVDYKITNDLDTVFAREALNLSADRIALLESNWPTWKTRLTDFDRDTPQ